MKEDKAPKPGDMIVCETLAAAVRHIRVIGQAGPKYGGGADTLALCGAKVLWDTRTPIGPHLFAETRTGMRICKDCSAAYFKTHGGATP